MTLADISFSSSETNLSSEFEKQSSLLKRIAQQISDDREIIEVSILKDYYDNQAYAVDQLEFTEPFMLESLYTFMQDRYSDQNKQTEEISSDLQTVENAFSALKYQFQDFISNRKLETRQEDFDPEIMASILTEAKEEFRKLISENKSKEREKFQTVTKFLQHSQKDIRKEMVLFNSSVVKHEIFDKEHFKSNVLATLERTERLKRNLITMQIYFNRKHSEVEKLQQSVAHFNEKFMQFAVIFDKFWKQNNKTSSNTYKQLKEIDRVCNFLTEKIDLNANLLLQQSKAFAHKLAETKNILKLNKLNHACLSLSITKSLETDSFEIPDNVDSAWINNVDVLNQKLEKLLCVKEKSKEKLDTLKRNSNNFEKFYSLMKSMTRSYNVLLRYFISTQEHSQKFFSASRVKLNQKKEALKMDAEANDKSCKLRKIVEMSGNCAGDVSIWDEIRSELDMKLQNVDVDNIVFILKDIMKEIRKLLGEKQIIPEDIYETDIFKSVDCKEWDDFPSESLITDVSSELLVQSSDESTGELSEITLEE